MISKNNRAKRTKREKKKKKKTSYIATETRERKQLLKDHILIFLVPEHIRNITRILLSRLLSGSQDLRVLRGSVSLLLIRDLLKSVEFFSVELIEFGVDVYGELAQKHRHIHQM